jgi:dTDP-glucose pyrophosphorylase
MIQMPRVLCVRLIEALYYAATVDKIECLGVALIGCDIVGRDHLALILADNIFYGQGLQENLDRAISRERGVPVLAYPMSDPERYGVVEFDTTGEVHALAEKPQKSRSHYAVTGLYSYNHQVVDVAASLKPSARGELEITDINRTYLACRQLHVEGFGRGFAWLDTGTEATLLQTAQLEAFAYPLANGYSAYLRRIVEESVASRAETLPTPDLWR